jgi:hypothetical protein
MVTVRTGLDPVKTVCETVPPPNPKVFPETTRRLVEKRVFVAAER